jgi:hypothetical protein
MDPALLSLALTGRSRKTCRFSHNKQLRHGDFQITLIMISETYATSIKVLPQMEVGCSSGKETQIKGLLDECWSCRKRFTTATWESLTPYYTVSGDYIFCQGGVFQVLYLT